MGIDKELYLCKWNQFVSTQVNINWSQTCWKLNVAAKSERILQCI